MAKGEAVSYALKQAKQAQNGHAVLILGGDVAMIRAYNEENGFLSLFVRRARSYLRVPYVVPSWSNTRLKRLFEAHAVVARISLRRVCHLCKRERPMPCRFVAWRFLLVGLLQNIR